MIVIPLLKLTSPNTDAEPPEGGHLSLLQRKKFIAASQYRPALLSGQPK
jgi:hypothetical protein